MKDEREDIVLRVRKKDGSLEEWSDDKLIASVARSGLNVDSGENVAQEVMTWAIKESSNNVIDSSKVRDKIIEILEKNYPLVANTYKTYKKG